MSKAVCPYCRTAIESVAAPADPQADSIVCEGCDTPHHRDCYEENGGCTVFGCRFAPPDEPKVHVGTPEVLRAEIAAPVMPQLPPVHTIRPVATSPLGLGVVTAASVPPVVVPGPQQRESTKSRSRFILLGVFLGPFGAHSFYAGFRNKAILQLAITVCSLGFGAPMTWLWAVIDICTIERDNTGAHFKS
jgi:hypothetical protein